jgi:Fe-S cluster biosynthesis and repair protein YggX
MFRLSTLEDAVSERTVMCVKLKEELPALSKAPLPGELGRRIHEAVSAKAWEMWIEHQKMLMNEYRIDLSDKNARQLLKQQCEQYFWGEGSAVPPEFVPEKA